MYDPRNGSIYQVMAANKAGTDWYDEVTRTAPVQRTTLGFSGAGENSRFYVGLSGQDQKGILLNNSFKRYALRVNSEFDVLKNLRIGENIQSTYRSVLGQGGAAVDKVLLRMKTTFCRLSVCLQSSLYMMYLVVMPVQLQKDLTIQETQ